MGLDPSVLDAVVPAAQLPPMIGPARTALMVVDSQVDFVAPHGALGSIGLDFSTVTPALARVQQLIGAARSAGVTVVFLRVISRDETDSTALRLLNARKGRPPEAIAICRAGSAGADYYGVQPQAGDIEIEKVLFSGFFGTTLEEQLRALGIDTLLMTGFTTDCCVDCTAREAFHRNYNVFVVQDACAAYGDDMHYGALNGMANNCALLTDSEAVLAGWAA